MLKKLLLVMLFSGSLYSSYEYSLHISNAHTVVNNKEVFCACGRTPDCIMFFSGRPEYYCNAHVPEIERVSHLRPDDIQQLLASLNQPVRNWNHQDPDDISLLNMNGAHVSGIALASTDQGLENGK